MVDTNKNDLWLTFAQKNKLSGRQLEQFKAYAALLQQKGAEFNLTALLSPEDILAYHFQDSLEIVRYVDLARYTMIADVGTGAGFPAVPLKIMYPDMPFVLIEVNNKKVGFLKQVLAELGLTGVEFVTDDWRTFLRHTQLPIDLFLARASLQPEELLRIFKGQSPYQNACLIYWASQYWKAEKGEGKFMRADYAYSVGGKKRRYIVCSKTEKELT